MACNRHEAKLTKASTEGIGGPLKTGTVVAVQVVEIDVRDGEVHGGSNGRR